MPDNLEYYRETKYNIVPMNSYKVECRGDILSNFEILSTNDLLEFYKRRYITTRIRIRAFKKLKA